MDKQLQEFKDFVRKYPGLRAAVRDGQATWQSLYEEWYLYGDSDSQWNKYKEPSPQKTTSEPESETKAKEKTSQSKSTEGLNGTEMMTQAIQYIQKMDMNKVQQTMGTVQQFIQIFQTMQGGKGGGIASPGAGSKQSFPGLFSKFDD